MKKIVKTNLFVTVLSLAFGCGVLAAKPEAQSADAAAENVLNPDFVNDYQNSNGQSWQSNSDPSDGQSSDPTTYRNALKSTTSGFKNYGVFDITTKSSSTITDPSYIQAKSSNTDDFLAQYVPAHMEFSVPRYSKVTYTLTFNLSAKRSQTGGNINTRADFSTEFFWYGETVQTPTTWFYHSNDFTTSTGRGYSQYRVADEIPGNTADHDVVKTVTFENNTSSAITKNVYFGMLCYLESSGEVGAYTGKLSVSSTTRELTNAVAQVNGTNYYNAATAISAYNATASSTMTLLADLDASASNYTLSSASGTISLVNHSMNLGSRYLSIGANTTITASNAGKVTSSAAYATVAINTGAVLTLDGTATIENTCTSSTTARAVLLGDASAKIFIGENAQVTTNYCGVQIDNGYLYCAGKIISSNNSHCIYIGSSDAALKYVYLYGSNAQVAKIRINNITKTRLCASYNSVYYTGSGNVNIELNDYTVGTTIVRGVNDSNSTKFIISEPGYVLTKESTVLQLAYTIYSVSYTLTNITTDGASTCTIANDFSFTLTPDTSFELPANIQVRVGSTSLTKDTDYTYDRTTGEVVLYKERITNVITVTASAIQLHTVTFIGPNGNEVIESMEVTHGTQYTFVAPSEMPDYNHVEWYENEERTGTVHYAGNKMSITSDITFYATYAQYVNEKCNEFKYVYMHMDDYNSNLGYCKDSEHHYYTSAKYYFENHLDKFSRGYLHDNHIDVYNRFCAWARANGEEVVKNSSGDYVVNQAPHSIELARVSEDNSSIIIISVTLFTSLALTTLLVLKKKKFTK